MTTTKTEYEPVIGLEVHVQLKTNTKMFCGCAVKFGAPANSLTCPVCLGLPGALPMVNKQAVEYGIKIGLALNCQIAHHVKFDRKNYFYPDLPKGYQISQYDEPLCFDGQLQLSTHDETGQPKICRITRAHLEEDAGKSIHMENGTLVDLNRAGTPLVEIVGGPDLRSPDEAYDYLTTLKRNLSYLGVSDLSMEKGSLRCDANISVRPKGQEEFGVRSEIKNMNSFRAVKAALEHEIQRHIQAIENGETLTQDTRLWDEDKLETRAMRSKEEATDYRFFPEPDLGYFDVPREWVEEVRSSLPEMPNEIYLQLRDEYALPDQQANYLVSEFPLATTAREGMDTFRKENRDHKKFANFATSTVGSYLNENNVSFEESGISTGLIAGVARLLDDGKLNNVTAREVLFEAARLGETDPIPVARSMNKLIEQDEGALDAVIAEVIEEFKDKAVADFKNGEQKALGFLIGQCMRKLKGKANPKELGPKIAKAINQG